MPAKKSKQPKTIKGKVNKALTGDGRKSFSMASITEQFLGKPKKNK